MKRLILLLVLFTLTANAVEIKDNIDANESERPSRLEAGYGNSEILSDSMPYLPKVKKGENIQFLGDLRLRSQSIKKGSASLEHFFRFRARFGLNAKLVENLKIEFMLASGNGDPVSTNQSIGNGFSGKDIVIDVADVYYTYGYHSFVRAGKIKLPLYRTHKNQIIFDGDLRPEGAFVKHKLFSNTDITVGAFVVANLKDVKGSNQTDPIYLYTAQLVQYISDFRIVGGYYHYDNLMGHHPSINDKDVSKGNSLNVNNTYVNAYHMGELALQYDIGDFSFGVDTIYNFGAEKENFAYNISAMYGTLKNQFDNKLGYFYRVVEKDAVLGAFSDSDFAGGNTGFKGHQLMWGMQLIDFTQLAVTYINAVDKYDTDIGRYQRLHVDLKFTFKSI